MDYSANDTCFLVLQRDVLIQFQSIQLATKLDTNAQMEMFFQLYHCVMATHFKPELLHSSGLKKLHTLMPKQDQITHGKPPDHKWITNKVANFLAKDGCSGVMKQITTPLHNKASDLPTAHLENENVSANHSQFSENQLNISCTSDSHHDLDNVNSQQIAGKTKTNELKTDTSMLIGSTETFHDSGSGKNTNVLENQSTDSTRSLTQTLASSLTSTLSLSLTSTLTSVRKGRRKSAPKRAAPVEDDDLLDMQLLMKKRLDDDDFITAVNPDPCAVSVQDKDNKTIPTNTEMTDSLLLQQYRNSSNFELPTMVHGTNYRPMTSKMLHRKSSTNKNNHDMSTNNDSNSGSLETDQQDCMKTAGVKEIKKESAQSTDKTSEDGNPEMDDADRLSNSGDLSDDLTPRSGPLQCEFCSFTSHRRYNLNRHRRIHTGNMFRCEKCERKFNEPGKLKSHKCKTRISKTYNKQTYSCDVCSASGMKSVESLRQHVLLKHNIEDTFVCVTCSSKVIFHDPQEFKNHLESLHTINNRSLPKSVCDECGREFKYLRSLEKHKQYCIMSMYKTNSVKVQNATPL